jgi:hypothetical protein
LSLNGRYRDSAALLDRLQVLPYEGANEGRRLHREAHLMLAVEALRRGDRKGALERIGVARTWPEHLGAGKPYPADVDERLEDWLEWRSLAASGGTKGPSREAQVVLERVSTSTRRPVGAGGLARALALRDAARTADAEHAIDAWVKATPDAGLATWGRSVFSGQPAPAPGARHAAGEYAVIAAAMATSPAP